MRRRSPACVLPGREPALPASGGPDDQASSSSGRAVMVYGDIMALKYSIARPNMLTDALYVLVHRSLYFTL